MTNTPDAEATARSRHLIISLSRLLGGLLVVVGILVINRTIEWPDIAGYGLILVGLVDTFVVPLALARRWRTPTE